MAAFTIMKARKDPGEVGETVTMTSAIDFYFDFSSPYGYLAAQAIDDIGARHGIDVAWAAR